MKYEVLGLLCGMLLAATLDSVFTDLNKLRNMKVDGKGNSNPVPQPTLSENDGAEIGGTNDAKENPIPEASIIQPTRAPTKAISYTYRTRETCPESPDLDDYSKTHTVPKFIKFDRVVLVTKIIDEKDLPQLMKAVCLLQSAYNSQPLYDYIVFYSADIAESQKSQVRQIVEPATVTFVKDSKSVEEEFADLAPNLQGHCDPGSDKITWETNCKDGFSIGHNWMSEFRAKWMWQRPELEPYKYMMFFDIGIFIKSAWREDPIEYLIKNDLVLLMDDYPADRTKGISGVNRRIRSAYGKSLCAAEKDGKRFKSSPSDDCAIAGVSHGSRYFYITDLDFYRQPEHAHFRNILLGGGRYSKVWDDGLTIAVSPMMTAPERVATLEQAGVCVFVNSVWDDDYWGSKGEEFFPEAFSKCGSNL